MHILLSLSLSLSLLARFLPRKDIEKPLKCPTHTHTHAHRITVCVRVFARHTSLGTPKQRTRLQNTKCQFECFFATTVHSGRHTQIFTVSDLGPTRSLLYIL